MGARRRPRSTFAVPLGVLAAAACATLLRLGRQPLWFDEIATARASALSWSGLRALLGQTDANLGTYYAMLHLLGSLGHSPAWLRLPSALAAVGTVVLTAQVGRRLLGPAAGLGAAALVVVHPFATAYARDARPYALVECCCTGALLLGLRATQRPSVGRLTAYASVAVVAVFLQLYAVLPLGAYALALLPAAAGRRRWLLAQLPALVAGLGVLGVSLTQSAQLSWVPSLSVAGVVKGLVLLCGGAVPALALLASGVVLLRDPAVPPRTRRLLAAGLVLPVGALLVASALRPTFVPRYLVATVPLQCLLVAGAAATSLRRAGAARLLAPALLVAVAGWFVASTVAQDVAPFRYEDYRAASRALLAGAQRGDAVVYEQQGARLGLDYYLPRVHRGSVAPPADVLLLAGAPGRGFAEPERTGPAAALALAPHRRVWVVRHLDVPPSPVPGLARYACAGAERFGLVAVQLCQQ